MRPPSQRFLLLLSYSVLIAYKSLFSVVVFLFVFFTPDLCDSSHCTIYRFWSSNMHSCSYLDHTEYGFYVCLFFLFYVRCFIFKVFNVTVLKLIVCVFSCVSVEVFIEFVFCLVFLPQSTVNICCELLVSSITLYM